MTVRSKALAHPANVAFYPCDDAGGTTCDDVGTNNLNATYSITKVSGEELTTGGGTSLRSTLSPGIYAQRTVASATPLYVLQEQSWFCWFNASTMLSSGGWPLFGRAGNLRIMLNASGVLGFQAWVGGVVTDHRWQAWVPTAQKHMAAVTWDGKVVKLYLNGERILTKAIAGTITPTTDAMIIAALSGSSGFDGDIKDCGVFSAALNDAEIKDFWKEGSKDTPVAIPAPINQDNIYNDIELVAASAAGEACAGDGGTRKIIEPDIIDNAEHWHPDCYAAQGKAREIQPITSSSAPEDYDQAILRLYWTMMTNWTRPVTNTTKTHYLNSSNVLQPQASLIGNADVWGPFGLSGAIVARHMGLSKRSWLVRFCINQVERLIANQAPTGQLVQPSTAPLAGQDAGWDFNQGPLAEAIMCLRPHLDLETYARWKNALLKSAIYEQNYPSGVKEADYYVNGNREAGSVWGAWGVYRVMETSQTLEWFEEQVAFWLDPQPKTSSNHANGQGRIVVPGFAGSDENWTDSKVYMQERASGPNTIMDGYCPNYVALCNSFVARSWVDMNGKHALALEMLRTMNGQYNLNMDRVNTTTAVVNTVDPWGLDGRGGSRQNNVSAFTTVAQPMLKRKGGRSDITEAYIAAQWKKVEDFFLGNLSSTGITRTINTDLVAWLMTTPQWPGLPD